MERTTRKYEDTEIRSVSSLIRVLEVRAKFCEVIRVVSCRCLWINQLRGEDVSLANATGYISHHLDSL